MVRELLSLGAFMGIEEETTCHHNEVSLLYALVRVPPTTLTPGIRRSLICFSPFLIMYSIFLKSERLTVAACRRNSDAANLVEVDDWLSGASPMRSSTKLGGASLRSEKA